MDHLTQNDLYGAIITVETNSSHDEAQLAGIFRTLDHDSYGDLEFYVEWEDNDGVGREKRFKSRRAAERFALRIESELLVEAVERFTSLGNVGQQISG